MTEVNIAFSSYKACFICREKNRSLHRVKKPDIVYAYVNHKIYIKHHARVCDAHFDENKLIKKDEFHRMPTKKKIFDPETINMFDLLCQNASTVFEKFKDIKFLEDGHCRSITGWSKNNFLRFSKYITSIKNNMHRTKEQLIALYRYWLHTGMSQKDLSYSFGPNTNQRNISHYLNQIRLAIYKDFVPKFLGSNNDRQFFLKFNTVMTHNLHDLEDDVLVLIADGTSCKIQKSSNNEFQYKTYSMQKTASLFKPFIICCADGYIVDCYGPFAANVNDSTILNYILENDPDFNKLLIPNKTLFLIDRGKISQIKIVSDFSHHICF